MSGGSLSNGSVEIAVPQKHVSAQVLQQMIPPRLTGFLRKRGKRERILENIKFARSFLASILRWRQRFVIVSHGCLYIYASETSTSPLQTLSLRGYNRLVKMESEQSPWTFRVVAPDELAKMYYFACHSDTARKEWMTAIREELIIANDVREEGVSSSSVSSDIYVYLQKPVFEPPTTGHRPPAPIPDDNSDNESTNSDYDIIDEKDLARMRPSIPLPPTPQDQEKAVEKSPQGAVKPSKKKEDHDYINRPKNIKPSAKPKTAAKPVKTNAVSRSPSEAEYFYPGNNRDEALAKLREHGKVKGTYLVRKSRTGDDKVLAVMTEEDIKEYKILKKDNEFTINSRDTYKSVEDLLVAYHCKPLPNRATTLTRGYGSVQDLRV